MDEEKRKALLYQVVKEINSGMHPGERNMNAVCGFLATKLGIYDYKAIKKLLKEEGARF